MYCYHIPGISSTLERSQTRIHIEVHNYSQSGTSTEGAFLPYRALGSNALLL